MRVPAPKPLSGEGEGAPPRSRQGDRSLDRFEQLLPLLVMRPGFFSLAQPMDFLRHELRSNPSGILLGKQKNFASQDQEPARPG